MLKYRAISDFFTGLFFPKGSHLFIADVST